MEKTIKHFNRGKSGVDISYEAWLKAGKPESFRFNHRTNTGTILRDTHRAKKTRELRKRLEKLKEKNKR